ncbi:EKC/KEOPS complex subunit bud32 [Aspergillus ambiguus]|uniref:serine/threonine protein kinase BUD32 n=1 Tax=Aspergillus ambiguus TaxID=176160 RepID=UPI003CCD6084
MQPEAYKPPALPSPFTNTTPPPELLTQGAEAHLYKTSHLSPSNPAALKIRPSKPYRHPILDRRLTRQRILQEARCLAKLVREGVNVPAVLALDWEGQGQGQNGERATGGAWLLMEWIDGPVLRVVFEKWEAWMKRNQAALDPAAVAAEEHRVRDLMKRIGQTLGALHKAGVVHGDLTTSNLILRPWTSAPADGECPSMDGDVVLIDFGLAGQSTQTEDRAVDLYVLERAFGSTHPRTEPFFDAVLQGYVESYKGANVTLKKLEEVRMRGRKRSMIG